jgi:hypothetical protein
MREECTKDEQNPVTDASAILCEVLKTFDNAFFQ